MYFILQIVEEQLTGKRRTYSKDFLMCDRQHLMLEYEEVESSSEWAVTLNQSKVILLEYVEHFKILEFTHISLSFLPLSLPEDQLVHLIASYCFI